ncbi:MAG: nucleotidyltransferase [Syntrophomonadaceae bacterium]
MAVLGIVAEFNPFHNGHLYLITEAQKRYNFSATVCVMSGNFLQRGEPAICNKWTRAEMALASGADLIIELPFGFATRSAFFFARGAVQLLSRTGVVTHLAFGSESGDIESLQSIARLIANEPDDYQILLKQYLSMGLNFPAARSKTVEQLLAGKIEDIHHLLMSPNNILALEYLRAIALEKLCLTPITLNRIESGYHSKLLCRYASASAIRNALEKHQDIAQLTDTMPARSLAILEREIRSGRAPVHFNAMAESILTRLRTITLEDLGNIYEVTEGLEHRIKRAALACGTIDELINMVKSKRYSFTRISRILLYSLCNLSKNLVDTLDENGPLYFHILGFSSKGQKILHEIKNNSELPLLTRGSEVKQAYNKGSFSCRKMIGLDVLATDLYTLFYPDPSQRKGSLDFTTSAVRIDN